MGVPPVVLAQDNITEYTNVHQVSKKIQRAVGPVAVTCVHVLVPDPRQPPPNLLQADESHQEHGAIEVGFAVAFHKRRR